MNHIHIRLERPDDAPAVHAINEAAFGGSEEADIVERLRAGDAGYFALVAVDGDEVLGHIAFSRVTIGGSSSDGVLGLAPMGVAPAYQREGIGSKLVVAGLAECRRRGVAAVIVLGHPSYYPRFGFQRASRFGLACEYDAPDDAFMAIELEADALHDAGGTVRYHVAFGEQH